MELPRYWVTEKHLNLLVASTWESLPEQKKRATDRVDWEDGFTAAFRLLCDVRAGDPDELWRQALVNHDQVCTRSV